MSVSTYLTINGHIYGESTLGDNRAYGLDATGSVVATYINTGLENTYQFKPYGEIIAKTGTGADPAFLWNGSYGYRTTSLGYSDWYVRRRHLGSPNRFWTTVDVFWPKQYPYGYALANPISYVDPCGAMPTTGGGSGGSGGALDCCWIGDEPSLQNQSSVNSGSPIHCPTTKCSPHNDRVGDYFEVSLTLHPNVSAGGSLMLPQVEWWECSNVGDTAGIWQSMSWLLPSNKCNSTWPPTPGQGACGRSLTGFLSDEPTMCIDRVKELASGRNGKIGVRSLFIYVAFRPQSTCPSIFPFSTPKKPLRLFQQIAWDSGSSTAFSVLQTGWPIGKIGPTGCWFDPPG